MIWNKNYHQLSQLSNQILNSQNFPKCLNRKVNTTHLFYTARGSPVQYRRWIRWGLLAVCSNSSRSSGPTRSTRPPSRRNRPTGSQRARSPHPVVGGTPVQDRNGRTTYSPRAGRHLCCTTGPAQDRTRHSSRSGRGPTQPSTLWLWDIFSCHTLHRSCSAMKESCKSSTEINALFI